jgi:hypothetical protein
MFSILKDSTNLCKNTLGISLYVMFMTKTARALNVCVVSTNTLKE